ncbi:MAG TPA: AAA family ATPase [Polyangia bacterium]|jgi:AAA+ superfamily predicted ATPase|nr:AAA family ATPase [Polyangia bacterium]
MNPKLPDTMPRSSEEGTAEAPPLSLLSPPEDRHLLRTLLLIGRAIQRRWASGLLVRAPDGLFTSVLGVEHVERLLGRPPGEPGAIDASPVPDHHYDEHTPLGAFVAAAALRPSQADLLAVLLGCDTDAVCSRLATYLGGNQSPSQLTLDLLLDIVYRPRTPSHSAAVALLQADLGPHAWLRRLGLVLVDGADSRATLAQGVRLHPRLGAWLAGQRDLDPDLRGCARLLPPTAPAGECEPKALATAVSALRSGGRLLLVQGPPRSGREMLIAFAAARLARPLLMVRARGLEPERLVAAFREACLQGAVLGLTELEELFTGERGQRLGECLDGHPDTVALIGTRQELVAVPTSLRPSTEIEVEVPPRTERLRLWRTWLGDKSALTKEELHQIAGLYNLGVSGIVQVSLAACEKAAFASVPVAREHVTEAVRQAFASDLGTIATRVKVTQSWDDLVLPDEVGQSVVSLIDRIRHRNEVLGDWGFGRKLGKGLGLTALFAGQTGTGKTMIAGLIAKELGLDLNVIDLSRVVSKWLGETEKNLGRAFDAAEAGHVMLLFDEADSVLGKRSAEVRSANDRYANLETNYILARLEEFQGVAVFTTNLVSAIDPAILRRMAVRLEIPFPDEEARADLWRRMLPAEAPVARDIDFGELGRRYELSGGFIRNIVLRAAYVAAGEGRAIGMAHLVTAAEQEYHEYGRMVSGGRLV